MEESCTENEAIIAGLSILKHTKAEGNSDFDQGMRALQKALGLI